MEEKTKKSNKKVSLLIKAVIVLVVVVIAFFLSQYVAEKNEKSTGSRRERIYAPVSYTHLDVYKRQRLNFVSENLDERKLVVHSNLSSIIIFICGDTVDFFSFCKPVFECDSGWVHWFYSVCNEITEVFYAAFLNQVSRHEFFYVIDVWNIFFWNLIKLCLLYTSTSRLIFRRDVVFDTESLRLTQGRASAAHL